MARRSALCSVLAVGLATVLLPSAPARAQAPTLYSLTVNFFPESPWASVNICVGEQREIIVGVTRYIYGIYSDGSVSTISETQYVPGMRLRVASSSTGVATVAPAQTSTGTGSAHLTVTGHKEGTATLNVNISGSLASHVPPALRSSSILAGPLAIPIKVKPCRYRISGYGTYQASIITAFMQLFPTYVDTHPSGPQSESGEVFGAAAWAGPCASIVKVNLPDATVTVEVINDFVNVKVKFGGPATAEEAVHCPRNTGQSNDIGTPDPIEFLFPARGGTGDTPHATGTELPLQGTFVLTAERIEQA